MRTAIDGHMTGNEQTSAGRRLVVRYESGTMLCGKYRLETLLGEGGMGAVWRASNVLLDLPVAIKLIRADLDRGTLRARLQLEARSAAKIGHPSIVRVFDVGESELGDPFIVMEHLSGETLAQLISRGRIPPKRAVQLLLPIIDALAVAHARGIVHRDLKPDNLMLAHEEQHVCPKILDFGIAKLTDPRESDHKLTEIGAVIGSPEYMSPEQARGREDIDASSDIWSICVVLYEAITGSPLFSASNCNALLRKIVEDAPKPLFEHGLDEGDLWQILERGLRKDRTQRYAEIAQLGRALAVWLSARGVTEDARGTTLDSKWLTHESVCTSVAEPPTCPDESQSRHTGDSMPESTGVVRGPFTNTIRPGTPARPRHVRTSVAAVCACALLALPLFALMRSPRTSASPVPAPAARPSFPAATAKSPSPPAETAPAATAGPAAALVTVVESTQSPLPTSPERPDGAATDGKRSLTTTRQAKPTSSPSRVATTAVSPIANGVGPAASKSERPLDLLPPY